MQRKIKTKKRKITVVIFSIGLFGVICVVSGFYYWQSHLVKSLPSTLSGSHLKTTNTPILPTPLTKLPTMLASPSPKTNPIQWQLYTRKDYDYEVSFPKSWSMDEAEPRHGLDATIHVPLMDDEVQKVIFEPYNPPVDSFIISVIPNQNKFSLEQLKTDIYKKTVVAGGVSLILSSSKTKIAGNDAYKFKIFDFDTADFLYVTIKNGYMYEIRFPGSHTNDQDFDMTIKIFNTMLNSFRFLDN